MLKQQLQEYFDRVYPNAQIDTEHTIAGKVSIRFELGEGQKNGTIERVNQATERAITLFNDTFPNSDGLIFILIYDYQGESIFNKRNGYLHEQFSSADFDQFYNEMQIIKTRYLTKDEYGNDVAEKDVARIIIGKLPVKDIKVRNILHGIANCEMGFDPSIEQRIYFFDPSTDNGFMMYDDRGCFVWSNNADKIRDIYIQRNSWIVDYDRPDIDKKFQ